MFSSRTPSAPWGSPPAASCSGCCSQRRLELHGSTVSSPAWALGMKIEKKAQSQIYTNIRQVSTDSPAFSFKSEVGWTMLNVFEQRRIENSYFAAFHWKNSCWQETSSELSSETLRLSGLLSELHFWSFFMWSFQRKLTLLCFLTTDKRSLIPPSIEEILVNLVSTYRQFSVDMTMLLMTF